MKLGSKSSIGWLQKKKILLLQSSSRSLTQQRFCGMTSESHSHQPPYKCVWAEADFCEEGWSKIPPECCAGQIQSYWKSLIEVIAPKGGSSSYNLQGFTYLFLQYCECLIGVFNEDARNIVLFCVLILCLFYLKAIVTKMNIRSHFMANLCIKPANSKVITYFFLPPYVSWAIEDDSATYLLSPWRIII